MSDTLLVLVPSRGRPSNITRLREAFEQTCSSLEPDLLIGCDDDDPMLEDYLKRHAEIVDVGPRQGMGGTLNRLALQSVEDYHALMFMGDDHCPRTQDWDKRLVDVVDFLGGGIAYGNDLFQGQNLPTAYVMASTLVQRLGWMSPPGLEHLYIDNSILSLGQAIGQISYVPEVVIEHLHPQAGKSEWDDGYVRVNSGEMYAKDRLEYDRWLREDLPSIVAACQ